MQEGLWTHNRVLVVRIIAGSCQMALQLQWLLQLGACSFRIVHLLQVRQLCQQASMILIAKQCPVSFIKWKATVINQVWYGSACCDCVRLLLCSIVGGSDVMASNLMKLSTDILHQ